MFQLVIFQTKELHFTFLLLQRFEDTKERIKKLFDKVELSVSAYDTAWVAMVPSPNSLNKPLFPECINWVLDNQHSDGSWGILHNHQLLMKATLLSTLACVLTLKRWNIGHDHMSKGNNAVLARGLLHVISNNLKAFPLLLQPLILSSPI